MDKQRIAFVSGSTRGIGLAVAKALLDKGCMVIGNSRKNDLDVHHELRSRDNYLYIQGDVTQEEDVSYLFKRIIKTYGRIDVLVNNVGMTSRKSFIASTEKDYDEMFRTNLLGAVHCSKYALKNMIFNKYGRIINISSIAGTNALPFEVLYSSSKAALIGLTKGIAKEYASKGVTCNVIAPGVIDTGAGNYDDIKKSIPTCQIGSPEDVAGLVAYLSSEEAAYITGQVIKIDGGLFI